MQYISLPQEVTSRGLPFYLAMEEYVARELALEDDAFFMWQVEPTVIFGRNQLAQNEVNIDYCRQHGIATYRRKSGGGCVYADMGNVMLSYITHEQGVNFTYGRYVSLVLGALHQLGIKATATGRNDIMVDGRKVSGNAFYRLPERSIVHGTLLYDTNVQHMSATLTPSQEKLSSKGVKSVRQRIGLLKDYTSMSLEMLMEMLRQQLCAEREWRLTTDDVACIEILEQEYLSPDFIWGHDPAYSLVKRRRIDGVGLMEARLTLKNGLIKALDLVGDYFLTGDLDGALIAPLIGLPLTPDALAEALPSRLDDIIPRLERQDFISLLCGEDNEEKH